MAVSLLLSVTWALVTPAFQAPDEQYHFAYVQSLVERQARPGDAAQPNFSTQMARGIAGVNSDQVASQLDVRAGMERPRGAPLACERGSGRSRRRRRPEPGIDLSAHLVRLGGDSATPLPPAAPCSTRCSARA